MSETWWKLEPYPYNGKFITPVEIIKQSECTVTVLEIYFGKTTERRKNKAGEYFPTFDAAKEYAISTATRSVMNAQWELDQAKEKLRKMRELTMPVEETIRETTDAAK